MHVFFISAYLYKIMGFIMTFFTQSIRWFDHIYSCYSPPYSFMSFFLYIPYLREITWYVFESGLFCLTCRHGDQWKKMSDPDLSPCSYGHLIFNKGAQSNHWRKDSLFHKWILVPYFPCYWILVILFPFYFFGNCFRIHNIYIFSQSTFK
jgi:hypothetical protein